MSACFPAGTAILTRRGVIPVDQVAAGDLVLTHTGRWQPVTAVQQETAGTVTVRGHGHNALETTPGQLFRSRVFTRTRAAGWVLPGPPEWTPAAQLAGRAWAAPLTFGVPLPVPSTPRGHASAAEVWTVAGRWLAGGWLPAAGRQDEWLTASFGGYTARRVPAWVLTMPAAHREALLSGYLAAAGHQTRRTTRYTAASRHLAAGIRLLALSLGHPASLYAPGPGKWTGGWTAPDPGRHPQYADHDGWRWSAVRATEPARPAAAVYSLTVAGDRSCIADGILVHAGTPEDQPATPDTEEGSQP